MALKTKLIMAQVIPYVIAGAVGAVSLIGVHMLYSGHYKKVGRLACEAKVEEANKKTLPITDTIKTVKDTADDAYETKTETIRTEVNTGITALDLARARSEAQNTGEELGRAKAIATYRAQGGCMSVDLPANDGLLVIGQDQQRAVFGDVIRGHESGEADEVRQNPRGYPLPKP